MSKYDSRSDMYEPSEIKLRYPEQPDPNAHWSDVWKDAFVGAKDKFISENPKGLVDLEFGIKTIRLAELSNISVT